MPPGASNILSQLAAKCNINNEKILMKSKEFLTLLHSKHQLHCSDICKAVVCLELASSLSSNYLSREEAIKYSGCSKKNYINFYNNISKLLNLDKIYSVREICLLVGVSDVQEPATKLLEKYKESNLENDPDFEHPMYPCAAVLAFCKNNKIKLNYSKLVEISRIKKQELEELTKRFAVPKPLEEKKEKSKNENKKLSSKTRLPIKVNEEEEVERKKQATAGVMTDEEYEQWKKKMLED